MKPTVMWNRKLWGMADGFPNEAPKITDADVNWVCDVLRLPPTAFSGEDGLDPRLSVLKSLDTLDIEACPGSGKTTLLVAKLAILANHWSDQRRGLCVLSHTNVARREIERKLGSTAAGQRLLRYPHFIGTIHAFVNEFLALPWLRSKGYPIEMVDDDVAQNRRMRKLSHAIRSRLETPHRTVQIEALSSEFDVGAIPWGAGTLGHDTESYQKIQEACRASVKEGYYRHNEMFVWAHDVLDKVPETASHIRQRFPLLFLDEVQDNSEGQSKLLHRIFIEGDAPTTRQRYGDSNQAIYGQSDEEIAVATDAFPIPAIRRDIANSFRFSGEIAGFADPLAVRPQGLIGVGGKGGADTAGKQTIFLFSDATMNRVLSAYAEYLVEVFSDIELQQGDFTAVAAVHRPGKNDHPPRCVGHYWPAYDNEIAASDPQPKTFVQYVRAGERLSQKSGESNDSVEKIAEAILRLARLSDVGFKSGNKMRKHRQVLELLADTDDARKAYEDLIVTSAIERNALSEENWAGKWQAAVKEIAKGITGVEVESDGAKKFLEWSEGAGERDGGNLNTHERHDNVFRYPKDEPKVAIRVGSIHSVKGETHKATLVLESFYRAHHLKTLKDWLTGGKTGGADANSILQSRLRQHYVAMTRPSHLLCLSMREDALADGDFNKLKERGWRLARVLEDGVAWLE